MNQTELTALLLAEGATWEYDGKFHILGGKGSGHFGHAGRPGKRGGSASRNTVISVEDIIRPVSSELDHQVSSNIEKATDFLNLDLGLDLSPDSVEKLAMENLEEFLQDSSVSIRVPPEIIPDIIKNGGVLNQHAEDVSSSGGTFSPELRALEESQGFNISEDEEASKYPIYGYVSKADMRVGQELRSYGDVEIVLKDSVKPRTTVTVGDSLEAGLGTNVGASPIESPRRESMGEFVSSLYSKAFHEIEYIETQIHGGVSLEDISRVEFHVPKYAFGKFNQEIEALQAVGIDAAYREVNW